MTDAWTAPAAEPDAPLANRALVTTGTLVGVVPLVCTYGFASFDPPLMGMPLALFFAGFGGIVAGTRVARRTSSASPRPALVIGAAAGLVQGAPFLMVLANVLIAPLLTGFPRPLAIVPIAAILFAILGALMGGLAMVGTVIGQVAERAGRGRGLVAVCLLSAVLLVVAIAGLVVLSKPIYPRFDEAVAP